MLIYKGFIEDVRSQQCTVSQINKLIEVFEIAVDAMSKTLQEEMLFNMISFEGTIEAEVVDFDFTMTRKKVGSDWEYKGEFIDGRKNFKILAILKN